MTLTAQSPRCGPLSTNVTESSPRLLTIWVWRTSARDNLMNRSALREKPLNSRRNLLKHISGWAQLTMQRGKSRRRSKLTTGRYQIEEVHIRTLTTTLAWHMLESASSTRLWTRIGRRSEKMKPIQPLTIVLDQRF